MRLLSITALGAALVTAGLVAPAAGEATASASKHVTVAPKVAQPGQRVELRVPGCAVGAQRHWASSPAFAGNVTLGGMADFGTGVATLKKDVRPGSYTVTAHCGPRTVTGKVKVSTRRSWPTLLPTPLNPEANRTAP
ncbi:hypothetical protein [Actinomadura hibisca]|uniref:hypothetical protein n=1 Tax=Actinomadura hibisca TaxID=68565 RepID=UPI00082FE227|nr:hypothetical protein [Actinomadura hibisca]